MLSLAQIQLTTFTWAILAGIRETFCRFDWEVEREMIEKTINRRDGRWDSLQNIKTTLTWLWWVWSQLLPLITEPHIIVKISEQQLRMAGGGWVLGIYNNYNSADFRLTLVHSSQNSHILIPKPKRHSERQLGLGLCLYGIKMVIFQQHIVTLGHIEWPSLSVSKTSHLTKPDHCSPLSQIITSNSVADIVKWKISEQRGKYIENYKKTQS